MLPLPGLALDPDLAAEQPRDLAADREPEPGAAVRRLVVPSACWNASKISRSLSCGMPIPVSVTANAMTPSAWLSASCRDRAVGPASIVQRHAALVGELERVREQVLQHLLQPLRVGDDRRRHVAPSA